MFNMGFSEMIVIGVVALLVIGPKQLPEVAKVVGRLLGELRRATQDLGGGLLEVKNEVQTSINETTDEIMKEGHKIKESFTQMDQNLEDSLSDKEKSPEQNQAEKNEEVDG